VSLFALHIAVDWSAAGTPRTGKDSIWIAVQDGPDQTRMNPATRLAAEALLDDLLTRATAEGRRALIGFDFPFGYPRALSQAIRPGGDWRDVWARIGAEVTEGPANQTNRFDAAARLNALFPGHPGPFWGNGLPGRDIPDLPRTLAAGWSDVLPARRRLAEQTAKGAQEVWKLSGAGSVGSQALTGIAVLERLRQRHPVAVWPFEAPGPNHVMAEIYPSLLPVPEGPGPQDERQVATFAKALAWADATGLLARMLEADLPADVRSDEATMLGLGHLDAFRALAATPDAPRVALSQPPRQPMRPYERDPAAIYAKSFAIVRQEARIDRFPPSLQLVITRLVHACGMPEIADRLAFSPGAAEAGRAALAAGRPVIADCQMVSAGLIAARLPGIPVLCTLNDPAVPGLAADLGTTRSAAAVDLWRPHLQGAIVAIGNAPTALFHLLERLDQGWPRPALILGFPVGFVGAAESKAELAANPRGVPFLTLRGRKGGSAMAAAAVNALAYPA
jgi:precorrin-8X/cobalt-precorrin-8 methylmutase